MKTKQLGIRRLSFSYLTVKFCKINNKNGITIKPEKDTERVMDFISIRIGLLFPKLVWKINKNNRERKITTTTL